MLILDSMANLKKRLAGAVLLTVLSMVSICLLLPNSRVSTHLQNITLGTTIDNYSGLWSWHEDESSGEEDVGGGIRLVVFGDSWVDDTVEENQEAKGKSWPEVMCEEINCTSRLTFAATQPSSEWPSLPPTGVKTSNKIHAWAVENTRFLPHEDTDYTLPDLSTQIQAYLSLPPPIQAPKETIFVLSFGFWDIYDFARLDFAMAMNVTDRSIDEIFTQLDILYNHFDTNLYPAEVNATTRPKFKVIIPRLFDPTLTPGWKTHRPPPLSPSSVAEQQKNAVYLTERWNQMMENTMGSWINSLSDPEFNSTPEPAPEEEVIPLQPSEPFQPPNVNINIPSSPSEDQPRTDVRHTPRTPRTPPSLPNPNPNPNSKTALFRTRLSAAPLSTTLLPQKDIFYHPLPTYVLSAILTHALQSAGIIDGSGLGSDTSSTTSSFLSVNLPCVREVQEGEDVDGMVDVNGMLVCREQGLFLWWDAFRLGGVANGALGREVGERVRMGRGVRLEWEGGRGRGKGS